ncbi:hypothetical protein [Desulfogranum mediterraneum]|uniref:hypothetical protein n=1 Tax=Desulfogranum mediterraneum TaxID=160661 RepID=UPI00040DF46C|nr:hypothetical protein [Desulfogranum mediterraneum]
MEPRETQTTVLQPRQRLWLTALGVMLTLSLLQGCVPTQSGRPYHRSAQAQQPCSYYAGYSKKYLPYRQQLAAGQWDTLLATLTAEEEAILAESRSEQNLADELRLVGLMERASLALQSGNADKSLKYCRLGQDLIEQRESESYFSGAMSSVGSVFTDMAGAGEFGRYEAPGYEKVLLLDMAAMAYLLKGDDRAFNVARLAVQWQDEEKEKFEQELEELARKEPPQADGRARAQNTSQRLSSTLDREFAKYDDHALSVANAFVNPFGDYITGMVNEFKSIKIKSLLSNAHIAYKQALKLNPKSKVLKQAVRDTKRKRSASRLIHVVALDGFVPEKKVLSIPLEHNLEVELPTYEPIPSRVKTIKVTTAKGKVLATLSPVADVEALALRHQKDSLPAIQAMVVASVIRDLVVVETGNSLLGGLGGLVRQVLDDHQEPDTTSWMTLPSRVLAARIYPPKGLKTLKIQSYDHKGRKLAQQKLRLAKGGRHFVLVRSIDQSMHAYPSKSIWSAKK